MRTSRFTWLFALLLLSALVLAACPAPAAPAADTGAAAAPTTEAVAEAPTAEAHPFKIGLVTDVGRINDRSFNQSAWEGVLKAQADLGLTDDDVKYIETQDTKDYADNMAQFIDAGYPVIVTTGFGLGGATLEAAKNNPDILFIGIDQNQWVVQPEAMAAGNPLPNYAGLIFHEDQSGYLAGVLAASMSKSGIIAAVLGTDLVPPVVAFNEGYIAGAKSVNPDINVKSTYHPGEMSQAFVDPEWGAATAKQAIDQGADVVFGAGGSTGNGALQEVATYPGLYCIGVDTDQWETVPAAQPCLISSAMKLIVPGVADLITAAHGGTFTGGNFYGTSALAPFHDFDSVVPQEVKDLLAATKVGLDDGSISTGYGN